MVFKQYIFIPYHCTNVLLKFLGIHCSSAKKYDFFVILRNKGIFVAILKEGGGGFRFQCHIDVKHGNLSMDVTPSSVFPSWFLISDNIAITACSEQQKNYIQQRAYQCI